MKDLSSPVAPSFDAPHPPKPRYSVRVGVTGHRPDKLQQEATPRVRDDLLSLFAAIETAAVTNLEGTSQWYEPSKPAIRLVSSLAEGSDQFAAEIVAREFRARADEGRMRPRAADWSIDAILPAPKGDYVAASRVSARSEPGQPIDVAGQFLAAFALADRLVELPLLTHDGKPADGGDKPGPRPGGLQTSQPLDPKLKRSTTTWPRASWFGISTFSSPCGTASRAPVLEERRRWRAWPSNPACP